ncbi:hypothetical protein LJC48_02115 [Desulfovibrio sp. OttesenSCG-928-C06]|nr:hypothetical protein [Desulfovibrio sp. OttesenSCG-928-C06]
MSKLSLQFPDVFSHAIKKALHSSVILTVLAALAGALLVALAGNDLINCIVAFALSAVIAGLFFYLVDPLAYRRMIELKKKAAAQIDITDELLVVRMLDGSTLRFNRDSCCEKFSFEPNARMHGYYLTIHNPDGHEDCIYTSAKACERDALRNALRGPGQEPGEYPCGARPACSACREKSESKQPALA